MRELYDEAIATYMQRGLMPSEWCPVQPGDMRAVYRMPDGGYAAVYDFTTMPAVFRNLTEDQLHFEVLFDQEAMQEELCALGRPQEAEAVRAYYDARRGIVVSPDLGRSTEGDYIVWSSTGRDPQHMPFGIRAFNHLCDVVSGMTHRVTDLNMDDLVTHEEHGLAFVDFHHQFGWNSENPEFWGHMAGIAVAMGFAYDDVHPGIQGWYTDWKPNHPRKLRFQWERDVNEFRAQSVAMTLASLPCEECLQFEGNSYTREAIGELQLVRGHGESFIIFDQSLLAGKAIQDWFEFRIDKPLAWLHQWVIGATDRQVAIHLQLPANEHDVLALSKTLSGYEESP